MCWRSVWPVAVAMIVTLPAATLAMYATPSSAVADADELGTPATLYRTVPAGLLDTCAPASVVPAQFFTTTPTKPLPACGVMPATAARVVNSELVIMSTLVVSSLASGRDGYAYVLR